MYLAERCMQKSYLTRRCCNAQHSQTNDNFAAYRRLLNNITENLYVKGKLINIIIIRRNLSECNFHSIVFVNVSLSATAAASHMSRHTTFRFQPITACSKYPVPHERKRVDADATRQKHSNNCVIHSGPLAVNAS